MNCVLIVRATTDQPRLVAIPEQCNPFGIVLRYGEAVTDVQDIVV